MLKHAVYKQNENAANATIEEVFKEVDALMPVKISISRLKKMKKGLYSR